MPFICPNNTQETSTTTGTGTLTLLGPVAGARDFDSQLASGDTSPYTIRMGAAEEYGIGTFTPTDQLARTTVLGSTSGGALVDFGAGTKDVIATLPGEMVTSLLTPGSTGLICQTAANTYARRDITAGVDVTVTDGGGVAGPPTIKTNRRTLLFHGCAGDGVTDDTLDLQAAIDAGPGVIDGEYKTYLVTSTILQTVENVWLENAIILFMPSAPDTCWHVQKPAAAVFFRGGMRNVFFTTTDSTHAKTAILLEDTSGYTLERLGSSDWSDTGFDSIFLHTKGREFLTTKYLYVDADIGILIDQNPNTLRTQVLDADHFHFEDTYITVTAGADTPCVRIADGVNLSNMTFDGANPWVRPGADCLEWNDTASNGIASFNLTLRGVRTEQGTNAAKHSININKTGTNNLQNFLIDQCVLDTGVLGLKLRNVARCTVRESSINTSSGNALDVNGTCDDINWVNSTTSQSGSATASLTGMLMMVGLKQVATASPLPENFHLVVAPAQQRNQKGPRLYNTQGWAYGATVADDGDFDLPIGLINGIQLAIVTITGYNTSGLTREYGQLVMDPEGATIVTGSAGLATTIVAGFLSISLSAGIYTVTNKTGVSLEILVDIRMIESGEL